MPTWYPAGYLDPFSIVINYYKKKLNSAVLLKLGIDFLKLDIWFLPDIMSISLYVQESDPRNTEVKAPRIVPPPLADWNRYE